MFVSVALVGVALLPHMPAAFGEFSYDDREFVENNASIRTLSGALRAFAAPFPVEQPGRGLYRPLTNLSYAVDYLLFGDRAAGFHCTNLLLYGLTVFCILVLCRRLFSGELAAASVAIVFAMHPVHCEVVDSVAGRSELLSLLLLVLMHLSIFAARKHVGWRAYRRWIIALMCYALALLSKESAVGALAVVGVYLLSRDAHRSGRAFAQQLIPLVPFVGLSVGWFCLRYWALDGRIRPDEVVFSGHALETRLFTIGAIGTEYLRLMVAPFILQPDVYYEAAIGFVSGLSFASVAGWLLIAATVTLWLWLGYVVLRRGKQEHAVSLFGLSWSIAFLAPVSHVVPFGALMAERFLYAPSLGFAIVGVESLRRASLRGLQDVDTRRRVAIGLLFLGVCLSGWRSYDRAYEWASRTRLWESALTHVPNDHRAQTNMGVAYLRAGELDRGAVALARAVAIKPSYGKALSGLAYVAMQRGQLDQAEVTLKRIVKQNPRNANAWSNLGVIAVRRQDYQRARIFFRRALRHNPNSAMDRAYLAKIEHALSQHD